MVAMQNTNYVFDSTRDVEAGFVSVYSTGSPVRRVYGLCHPARPDPGGTVLYCIHVKPKQAPGEPRA